MEHYITDHKIILFLSSETFFPYLLQQIVSEAFSYYSFLIMQINTKNLGKIFNRRHLFFVVVIFPRIQDWISYADCLQWIQFA